MARTTTLIFLIFFSFACAHQGASHTSQKTEAAIPIHMSFGAVWDDAQRCIEAVKAGWRLPRQNKKLRLGTWNIRWFPDGKPGEKANKYGGTDVEWLACVIAALDVDILAVQEFKLTRRGKNALEQLIDSLNGLTHEAWAWESDICPDPTRQHVGFLYRRAKVHLSHITSHSEIDPTVRIKNSSEVCPGKLRPALAAYVASKNGGVDFHFVTSHLDAGNTQRDYSNRTKAWKLLDKVYEARISKKNDSDFIFGADFNSIGCPKCGVRNDKDEIGRLLSTLKELKYPLIAAKPSVRCTQYYRGRSGMIDQIVHSADMIEAQQSQQLITGICAAASCRTLDASYIGALKYLSDHCPVLMDIDDIDIDS
jgi:endonuclease/exonuclease/phosphatase family metal-dependent hydrolase